MKVVERLREWVGLARVKEPRRLVGQAFSLSERAHPIQALEAANYLYVPHPDLIPLMISYALNEWVYSAITKLSETAASAELRVVSKGDMTNESEDHGILKLLGKYGKPSADVDSFEFLEGHFVNLDLTGNSFWWWGAGADGLPGEVHLLDPSKVEIVPGAGRTVGKYIYRDYGWELPLMPDEVTHFKRFNPYSRYWGLSAVQAISITVAADTFMARWNRDFFGEDVALPAGILAIPTGTSEVERDRIERELNAKHAGTRRTMVARVDAGGTAWFDAGLKPRDMDFESGRILSRRSVYEALNLPLGIMSEASTEAHAIVSQRQFFESVELRHIRTERKLNSDGMDLWPAVARWAVKFEDIKMRATDWRRESLKLNTLGKFMTVDEIRAQYLNLGPRPKEDMQNGNDGALQGTQAVVGGASGAPRDGGGGGEAAGGN